MAHRVAQRELAPEWELLAHTPAVFVRVGNKEVAGFRTWKSVRKTGDKESGAEGMSSERLTRHTNVGPLIHGEY